MTFQIFLEILNQVEVTAGATESTVVLVKALANELEHQNTQGTLNVGAFAETLKQGAKEAGKAVAKNDPNVGDSGVGKQEPSDHSQTLLNSSGIPTGAPIHTEVPAGGFPSHGY